MLKATSLVKGDLTKIVSPDQFLQRSKGMIRTLNGPLGDELRGHRARMVRTSDFCSFAQPDLDASGRRFCCEQGRLLDPLGFRIRILSTDNP
jgi:hypothetical protein